MVRIQRGNMVSRFWATLVLAVLIVPAQGDTKPLTLAEGLHPKADRAPEMARTISAEVSASIGTPPMNSTFLLTTGDCSFTSTFQAATQTDLGLVLDGSGSVRFETFETIKNGLAQAIEDSVRFPGDGTIRLTVVQFGGHGPRLEPPVNPITKLILTDANRTAVANRIRSIEQLGEGTYLGEGVNLAHSTMFSDPFGDKQSILLITDTDETDGLPLAAAISSFVASGGDALNIVSINGYGAYELHEHPYPGPAHRCCGDGWLALAETVDNYKDRLVKVLDHSWDCNNESDCDGNGLYDVCELQACAAQLDCNQNHRIDACDVSAGFSLDIVASPVSGQPDECHSDCDSNGVIDLVDLQLGTHTDCDGNSRPDVCDLTIAPGKFDCNNNGAHDGCELQGTLALEIRWISGLVGDLHPPAEQIALADFDGNGFNDLAVAASSDFNRNLYIYWNEDGQLDFSSFSQQAVLIGNYLAGVAAGDLDGDQDPDLVVTQDSARVYLIENRRSGPGDRNLQPLGDSYGLSSQSSYRPRVALSDLDGDGALDAVFNDNYYLNDNLSILWGVPGSVSFNPTSLDLRGYASVAPVLVMDQNKDSKSDLVISSLFQGALATLNNQGGRVFGAKSNLIDLGLHPEALAAGDLNQDGTSDILVGLRGYEINSQIRVLLSGDPVQSYVLYLGAWTDYVPIDISVVDLDQNGFPEIVAVTHELYHHLPPHFGSIWIWQNLGVHTDGTWRGVSRAPLRYDFRLSPDDINSPFSALYRVLAANFDSDGLPDILTSSFTGGSLSIYKNISIVAAGVDQNRDSVLDECGVAGEVGDLNCSGTVDAFDIGPFVLAITDPQGYVLRPTNRPPVLGA